MAPEIKSKKRKATVPDDEVEKVGKVKQMAAEVLTKKRKATDDTEVAVTKKPKAPKLGTFEDTKPTVIKTAIVANGLIMSQNSTSATIKKPKSSKDVAAAKEQLLAINGEIEKKAGKRNQRKIKETKSAKKTSLAEDVDEEEHVEEDEVSGKDSEDEEIDDQTDALLKGFESNDDEVTDPEDQGYEAGQNIPKINKKAKKEAEAAQKASRSNKSGVIYVGRIPHGFYEQEMRKYFSQFGDISKLRLSRNRKTGRSKHFAFIEFKSAEVAEIVSKTMDNYLLFGHILKCKMVMPEQVHEDLWKGANKRFKQIPWNKMEGRKLEQGITEAGWEKRVKKEETRRAKKEEAMKLMDYEFERPKLKSPKGIASKVEQFLAMNTENEPNTEKTNAIMPSEPPNTALPEAEAAEPTKKSKKKKTKTGNGKAEAAESDPANDTEIEHPDTLAKGSNKKTKKSQKTEKSSEKSSEKIERPDEIKKSTLIKDTKSETDEKAVKVKKSKKIKAV